MDRNTATFVDGLGAAAATSGVLTQQQARIFALLYLHDGPFSLDDIAAELEQSKSTVSINVRALVDWHLVRRKPVLGSRKDHYVAATDFFHAMQEIFERRFRWTVRQVLAVVDDTQEGVGGARGPQARFVKSRLDDMGGFFRVIDTGIGMFLQGQAFPAHQLRNVVPLRRRRGGS